MPWPIDGAWIERELAFASSCGVVRAFSIRRRSQRHARTWVVTLVDGTTQRWTAGPVAAFLIGVRATVDALEGADS